jgi:hypothetical protein
MARQGAKGEPKHKQANLNLSSKRVVLSEILKTYAEEKTQIAR